MPDTNQIEYYKEQIELWRLKADRFKSIPMIKANAERNINLYKNVIAKITRK